PSGRDGSPGRSGAAQPGHELIAGRAGLARAAAVPEASRVASGSGGAVRKLSRIDAPMIGVTLVTPWTRQSHPDHASELDPDRSYSQPSTTAPAASPTSQPGMSTRSNPRSERPRTSEGRPASVPSAPAGLLPRRRRGTRRRPRRRRSLVPEGRG